MLRILFVSNNDDLRRCLPFGGVEMKVTPAIGDKVRFDSYPRNEGKVQSITHLVNDKDNNDIEIYLTK